MSKEILHNLIDMIPDTDADVIYRVLVKFIPTDIPSDDEIQSISAANKSISTDGTVSMNEINWD